MLEAIFLVMGILMSISDIAINIASSVKSSKSQDKVIKLVDRQQDAIKRSIENNDSIDSMIVKLTNYKDQLSNIINNNNLDSRIIKQIDPKIKSIDHRMLDLNNMRRESTNITNTINDLPIQSGATDVISSNVQDQSNAYSSSLLTKLNKQTKDIHQRLKSLSPNYRDVSDMDVEPSFN